MVKSKLIHAATVAGAALAVTLLVGACGGGGGDPEGVASLTDTGQSGTGGDGAATTGKQDPQDAALDYAQCMREHGVDMPDPGPDGEIQLQVGPDDDREKVQEAQEACKDILQDAGPRLSEEQQTVMQDALLAFAKCMREHGIDMPDPQFGEGGMVTQQGSTGMDPDDPKFQEAQEACEPIMEDARREAGLPNESPSLQRSGGDS
jgi:hypothetical protein